MKFLGVDATNLVAETRSLPSYLHGLHGTRLHPRLWRILLPRDSRSYARTPIRLVEHRSRIHQYKSKSLAKRPTLSRALWLTWRTLASI